MSNTTRPGLAKQVRFVGHAAKCRCTPGVPWMRNEVIQTLPFLSVEAYLVKTGAVLDAKCVKPCIEPLTMFAADVMPKRPRVQLEEIKRLRTKINQLNSNVCQ